MKRDIALATQAQVIRVKVAELRPPGDDSGVLARMMRKIAAIRRGEPVIEIEADAKTVEP